MEDMRFRVSAAAPSSARQAVGLRAELEPYPDLRFAAMLLASELAANAVRHAGLADGDSFVLSVTCDEETLHVDVRDSRSGFNPLALIAVHRHRGERHRGLILVDALADRWGYRRARNECCVWFELDLVPGRRPWAGRVASRAPRLRQREEGDERIRTAE